MGFESTIELFLKIMLNLTVFPFSLFMSSPLTIIVSAKTPAAIFVNNLFFFFWKAKSQEKANDGKDEVKPKGEEELRKKDGRMGKERRKLKVPWILLSEI